ELSVPGAERGAATRVLPIVALGAWVLLLAVRAAYGPSEHIAPSWGPACVRRMAVLALAPGVAAFLMLRKAAPLRSGRAGLPAVLAAGALAVVGMQTLCPHDEARHVLVWHLGPLLAAAAVGAVAGRAFLGRRGRERDRAVSARTRP